MKNHLLLTLRKFLFAILAFSMMFLYPLTFVHAEGSMNVTEMSATATVGDSKLNVRSGPGKDYDALGSVSPGETLTITGQSDSWYRIDYAGQEGYVSSKYVTISNSSDGDTSSAVANVPNDFSNYEEGSSQHDNIFTTSPKLLLLLAVIIIVVIIMITTIIMIRKSDSDDDDVYDDDDDDDDDDEYDVKPIRHRNPQKNIPSKKQNASTPSSTSASNKKNTPVRSTRTVTEEDYRLDIDPRIFDDEPSVEKTPVIDKKAQELDAAMSKLEELQQEIERLKNS